MIGIAIYLLITLWYTAYPVHLPFALSVYSSERRWCNNNVRRCFRTSDIHTQNTQRYRGWYRLRCITANWQRLGWRPHRNERALAANFTLRRTPGQTALITRSFGKYTKLINHGTRPRQEPASIPPDSQPGIHGTCVFCMSMMYLCMSLMLV